MRTTRPTRPSCSLACSAMIVAPSAPDRPTATRPCSFIASTSSWFTWPASTERTTFMASSVVTRWPSMNFTGISKRFMASEMASPPPCTITGFTPMIFRSTMSAMTSARSCSSTMADPPYLMTMVLPVMFLIHGIASASTSPVVVSTPFGLLSLS